MIGFIVYNDQAKIDILNVAQGTIAEFTAVSAEICCEMAIKCQDITKTDVSIAITGYADFYKNIERNGLVFIGVKINDKAPIIQKNLYFEGRNENRTQIAWNAIDLLCELLK